MFEKPFRLVSPLTREECAGRLRAAAQLEDPVHFTYHPVPGSLAVGTVRDAEYLIRCRRSVLGRHGHFLEMRLTDEGAGSRLEGRSGRSAWEVAAYFWLLAILSFLCLRFGNYWMAVLVAGYFLTVLWRSRGEGPALVDFVKRTVEGEDPVAG